MRHFVTVLILTVAITSCILGQPTTPTSVPPTATSMVIPTHVLTHGNVVTLNNVSLTIPEKLANDALLEMVSAKTDGAPWEIAPDYLQITLTGYEVEGKFHEPQVFVFPADEYAQVSSIAAEQIERLKRILAGSLPLKETIPNVPFFNAGALIAANIQLISFQSGSGVREVTQYDQYPAPINNHELFYHFEGLTTDEKYYIIAILPITAPILAEDEKPESSVPTEGVPIPTDIGPSDAYYALVTEKLVSLDPDSYTPSLNTLDELIQSIVITNS